LAGIITLDGVIVSVEGSALVRLMVAPPCGAGAGKLTGNVVDWPSPTVAFDGSPIWPRATSVTVAVAFAMPATFVLAVIVVEPFFVPKAVTGTFTVVPVAWNITDAGTVATLGSDEVRLTSSPLAGAGEDKVNVKSWTWLPRIVTDP